jgi:hypothetical protein
VRRPEPLRLVALRQPAAYLHDAAQLGPTHPPTAEASGRPPAPRPAARTGGTRTCIHTPGAALAPEEMTPGLIASALQGAGLAYFDGRLTEAALLLARAARAAGIPVRAARRLPARLPAYQGGVIGPEGVQGEGRGGDAGPPP